MQRRSRLALLLLMVVGALALATPAWAHGQVRPGRGAGGATIEAVLVVPSERDGHTNKRIALALPPGFTPRSCGSPIGWRCSTVDKGFSWERVTGLVVAEDFNLTMQVSATPGTYVLPLSQTYDDDETRTFTGAPGSRDEAPLFTVTGGAGGGTSAAASPSDAPRAPEPTRSVAARPAASAAPTASASTRPDPGAPRPTAVSASMSPSALPADAGLAGLPVGRRLTPVDSGDSPTALIALGFLALTVLAGAVLLVRGRRSTAAEEGETGVT